MHHPIGLLRLPLPAKVGVEYHNLFKTLHCTTTSKNSSSFPCFVPSSFASFIISVNLSSFPCSCCVCFRRPVKEVADLPIFANSCIISKEQFLIYIVALRKGTGFVSVNLCMTKLYEEKERKSHISVKRKQNQLRLSEYPKGNIYKTWGIRPNIRNVQPRSQNSYASEDASSKWGKLPLKSSLWLSFEFLSNTYESQLWGL